MNVTKRVHVQILLFIVLSFTFETLQKQKVVHKRMELLQLKIFSFLNRKKFLRGEIAAFLLQTILTANVIYDVNLITLLIGNRKLFDQITNYNEIHTHKYK